MGACTAPFDYLYPNGTTIPAGVLGSDGVCIFAEADCSDHHKVGSPCCTRSDASKDGMQGADNWSNYGPMVILIVCIYVPMIAARVVRAQQDATAAADHSGRVIREEPEMDAAAHMPRSLVGRIFVFVVYAAAVGLAIISPIMMMESIQQHIEPAARTGVLFASAFLVPFEEVFDRHPARQ